jgi:hypothetical protein
MSVPTARPGAALVVAALACAVGIYFVVSGTLALWDADDRGQITTGVLDVVFGVALVVVAFGAFRVKRWAWVAFMTWAVVGLTTQLLRHFFFDDVNYVGMALNVISVLALTPLDTQIAFAVRPPRNIQLDRATRNPLDVA